MQSKIFTSSLILLPEQKVKMFSDQDSVVHQHLKDNGLLFEDYDVQVLARERLMI